MKSGGNHRKCEILKTNGHLKKRMLLLSHSFDDYASQVYNVANTACTSGVKADVY